MRTASAGGIMGRVSSQNQPERLELRLELDRGVEPISGRISTEAGTTVEFAGWLALAGALQRLGSSGEPDQAAGARRTG
jgi:hypothetical protein